MKSVCPVKVKINWRSGGGYRGNQLKPVVFKPDVLAATCSSSSFILFSLFRLLIILHCFTYTIIDQLLITFHLCCLSNNWKYNNNGKNETRRTLACNIVNCLGILLHLNAGIRIILL